MNNKWLDFNDAPEQQATEQLDAEDVKRRIQERLVDYLIWLYPNGKAKGQKFILGNTKGEKGKSLEVELSGDNAGLWHDFASGEGGDIVSLTAEHQVLNAERDFPEIMRFMADWLGMPSISPPALSYQQEEYEDLGAHTGKWDYHDGDGNLIACVYRYDTPEGKEFRPWDVKARKTKAPSPRPLYNQLGIKTADEILLVEGEKAAQALIDQKLCATTAMNGAKAPTDKTDWSPLKGKRVVIWPAQDQIIQQVSSTLNITAEPRSIYMGTVVKPNGPADRTLRTFKRNLVGLLEDLTARLRRNTPSNYDLLGELAGAIRECAERGHPLTHTGVNGVFRQRHRLPDEFHNIPRHKLENMVQELLNERPPRTVKGTLSGSKEQKWLDSPWGRFAQGKGEIKAGADHPFQE